MKSLILLLALLSTGCATLQRHPVLVAVGTAIIVGSITLLAEHDRNRTDLCGPNAPNRSNAVIGSCVPR